MSSELTHIYEVRGMTCAHCRLSVIEEVGEVEGVRELDVDLETGRLTVSGNADPAAVEAAVREAGYELGGRG